MLRQIVLPTVTSDVISTHEVARLFKDKGLIVAFDNGLLVAYVTLLDQVYYLSTIDEQVNYDSLEEILIDYSSWIFKFFD